MRVRLSDSVVAGPTSHAGGKSEVVLAPRGSFGLLTTRATPRLTERDLHGERVVVVGQAIGPRHGCGRYAGGAGLGGFDYADGSFELVATGELLPIAKGAGNPSWAVAMSPERASELTLASFNLQKPFTSKRGREIRTPGCHHCTRSLKHPTYWPSKRSKTTAGPSTTGRPAAPRRWGPWFWPSRRAAVRATPLSRSPSRRRERRGRVRGQHPRGVPLPGRLRHLIGRATRWRPACRELGSSRCPRRRTRTKPRSHRRPITSRSRGRASPSPPSSACAALGCSSSRTISSRVWAISPRLGRFQPAPCLSAITRLEQAKVVARFVEDILSIQRRRERRGGR